MSDTMVFLDEYERDPSWDGPESTRYVNPMWIQVREDEQLYKCAACNRFFAGGVPLVMFLGEGKVRGECLNLEICDDCAPWVIKARHG